MLEDVLMGFICGAIGCVFIALVLLVIGLITGQIT